MTKFSCLGLWDGGVMRLVLEAFGAWCAVSSAVLGLWTLAIYLGHRYRRPSQHKLAWIHSKSLESPKEAR